ATQTNAQATQEMVASLKIATETGKHSAQAALLNANATINAFRPWVLVELRHTGEEAFILSIKNWGRTPAEITAVKHLESFPDSLDAFKPDSRYEQAEELVYRKMLAPGDTWEDDNWFTRLSEVVPGETLVEVRTSRR